MRVEVHGCGCCNVERLKWCNLRAEWSESVSVYTEYGAADTYCHRLSYILTRGLCSYTQFSFPLCLSTLELGYQGRGEEASEAEPCLAYPCSLVWSLTDSESLPVAGNVDQTIAEHISNYTPLSERQFLLITFWCGTIYNGKSLGERNVQWEPSTCEKPFNGKQVIL